MNLYDNIIEMENDDLITPIDLGDPNENQEIKNVTDYALFISISNSELDGMVHYKDLSWSEKDTELQKYKKNQITF